MISLFISDLRAKKQGTEGGSQILIVRSCIGDLFLIPLLFIAMECVLIIKRGERKCLIGKN